MLVDYGEKYFALAKHLFGEENPSRVSGEESGFGFVDLRPGNSGSKTPSSGVRSPSATPSDPVATASLAGVSSTESPLSRPQSLNGSSESTEHFSSRA